ncbi:MAG: RNA polymerase sigma factor [Terriglobales bacterium]
MTAHFVIAEQAIATAQPTKAESLLEFAVREHSRLVYRIAYSVLRDPADAEDAVQEVFLRVLRYGNKAARIKDWKAWLARIAWRVAVERRDKVTQSSARHEQTTDDLPGPGSGADRVLLERERAEVLQRLIAALPARLRDPLVLATIDELSPREVATVLGISEAAVRSRAFRARQILRERLTTPGDRK